MGTDRNAIDVNLAGLDSLQSIDRLDERRFSRTRRAADHDHFALVHFGTAVGEHLDLAVPLGYAIHLDHENCPLADRRLISGDAEQQMIKEIAPATIIISSMRPSRSPMPSALVKKSVS